MQVRDDATNSYKTGASDYIYMCHGAYLNTSGGSGGTHAHGDVNGIDFWAVGENKGKIIHQEFLNLDGNTFTSSNFWKDGQGKTICQDERTFYFYEFDTIMFLKL